MWVFSNISRAMYNSLVMITHIIKMLHIEFLPSTITFKNKFGVVFSRISLFQIS